jgi:hypothetical protein
MSWREELRTVAEEALGASDLAVDDRAVWFIIARADGEAQAVTSAAVAAELGWGDDRDTASTVRHAIIRLRAAGLPVCSTKRAGGGYYLPATAEEMEGTIELLRSELIERSATVRRMEGVLDLARSLVWQGEDQGQMLLTTGER